MNRKLLLLLLNTYIQAASLPFCCASTNVTCGTCRAQYTGEECSSSDYNCVNRCKGTWCVGTPMATNCSGGTDFGSVTPIGTIRVPSYLLSIPPSTNPARRLLLDRHLIGVLRTIPIVGTITALVTPEYDAGGDAGLRNALIDTNNRVALLGDTVADLANKTALESQLRVQADLYLLNISITLANRLESYSQEVTARFSASAMAISLLSLRISVAEQTAQYLSDLSNNVYLARLPLISSDAQKFGKLLTLSNFTSLPSPNATSDVFVFHILSSFMSFGVTSPPGCGFGCFPNGFVCSQITRVTVTRKPTVLSYLSPVGDNYLYEVSYLTLGYPVSSFEQGLCGGTPSECTTYQLQGCIVDSYVIPSCWFKINGTSATFNQTLFPGVNQSFGECYGYTNTTCHAAPGLTCDNTIDLVGARPTFVFLPRAMASPYYQYIGNFTFPQAPFLNNAAVSHTHFFNPINVAKSFFPHRTFTLPPQFAELFNSGNKQDNLVFGDFGPMVDLPVGLMSGTVTPVVMVPELFPYSHNIISFYQGSVPLSGWAPTSGCVMSTDNRMCCNEVAVSQMLSTFSAQLGYDPDNFPPEYQPRNLFTALAYVNALVANFSTNFTVPDYLIHGLLNNTLASLTLQRQLANLSFRAATIANDSRSANERIQSLESRSGLNTATFILVLIIAAAVILLCCIVRSFSRGFTKL